MPDWEDIKVAVIAVLLFAGVLYLLIVGSSYALRLLRL